MVNRLRLLLGVTLLVAAACHSIKQNPLPTEPGSTPLVPRAIVLTTIPGELPAGGGTATVRIEVRAEDGRVVSDVPVTVTVSAGTLERAQLISDATGHAETSWTGTTSSTIQATSATASGQTQLVVRTPPAPAPTPSPGPSPSPTPAPTPAPTPSPSPTPAPTPPPAPNPPGDLVLAINFSPAAPNASTPVTLSGSLHSTTGAALPRMDWFAWDTNGDLANDQVGIVPTPVVTYLAGTYTVYLTVRTSDYREVAAQRSLFVDVAPALTVTLAGTPATANLATPVSFTATATTSGPTGAITGYAWDIDGDGTFSAPGMITAQTFTFPTIGAKTSRVRVTTANGQTATASAPVTVSDAPLTVALTGGPATSGVPATLTALVGTTGTVPAGTLTYGWDYQGDGTVDDTMTGGTTLSVSQIFNGTGNRTIKVTVTAPDGRTAIGTLTIPVS